ncbi:colanic acid biosynthesis glycosyltransferase WcaL [Oceanidesulfovibrio indonesiensis]|uniref:Colanic acid biosynthesis glycosyltransferase WcaL n=1 Tax=Oceanidesulfovibrio indonesiensis TaxID=54767 RepID=A0A7M3MJY1_9BACT|nr:glycosyltransferase family 4 protein [Oceanidesulfovibrio indonesiensis]TVM19990.1 colanic acid biosynthesis glycosyltransferase WcaL [Oceanidesulfovibrio indonesiensis]
MSRKTAPRTAGRQLGLVLKGYPRISETFIANEIRLLEELGFDIHIISMRKPRESFTHENVRRIQASVSYLPEHLYRNLHRFLYHNILLFLKHPRRYAAGIRLLRERLPGASSTKAAIKHLLQGGLLVHKFLPRTNIAHLHAHFAHSPTSVAQYASVLSGLDFSFTAHAKDIYTQKPDRVAEKMARAAFVVTCTQYNRRTLEKIAADHGFADKPVACVYHGIDLDLFSANGRHLHAEPPYSILTVARFVPKKGLFTILEALEKLADDGVDFTWTLVGDGELKRRLKKRIDESPINERVDLAGTLAHDGVLRLYEKADCFVLGCEVAKNGDRDGIPNVVAEAMAMGVPVAATDVSGIPELVEHESTGLLCPSGNPAALAANIYRLLTDQELRGQIIPEARKRVEQVFDNTREIRKLASVFTDHTGLGELIPGGAFAPAPEPPARPGDALDDDTSSDEQSTQGQLDRPSA